MSTFEDAQKFVTFIEQCFVDKRPLTSEGTSIPLPAIRATDMATQVSASNPGTDQDVGVPADLATGQTSWSIPSEGRLLDSVNPTEHCYPSVGTGMEDGSRLHHDGGVVARETQAHVRGHVSRRSEKDSTGGRSNKELLVDLADFSDEGGSGVVLRVGDVLQIFLRGKHGKVYVWGVVCAGWEQLD